MVSVLTALHGLLLTLLILGHKSFSDKSDCAELFTVLVTVTGLEPHEMLPAQDHSLQRVR